MKIVAPFRIEYTKRFKAYGRLTRFMLVYVIAIRPRRFIDGKWENREKIVDFLYWRQATDLKPWNAGRIGRNVISRRPK